MQGMLDTLSSPVAFATAPLGNPEPTDTQNSSANGSTDLNSKTPTNSRSLGKRDSSFGSDTEADDTILARLGRRIGGMRQGSAQKSSQMKVPLDDDEDFDESLFDDGTLFLVKPPEPLCLSSYASVAFAGDDLSESFLVIPSGSEPGALKKENAVLKVELANLQKRLEMAEKVLHLREKQDQQLRDSIYQAKREVRTRNDFSDDIRMTYSR